MKGNTIRSFEFVFLILLVVPLFLINLPSGHDWGGDFARYIEQAIHIAKGIPQEVTGYVYNPDYQMGPPAYPVGFPLLLAPVYLISGNDISAFILFISILLSIYTIVLYLFFRRFRSVFVTILLVFTIIYSPWLLGFKAEVMSDIPFALFFILFLWFHKVGKSYKAAMLSGLVAGFAILLKFTGFFIILALLIEILIAYFRWREEKLDLHLLKKMLLRNAIIAFIAVMTVFLLNRVIFNVPSDYSQNYLSQAFSSIFLHNFNVFIFDFSEYFFGSAMFSDDLWKLVYGIVLLIAVLVGIIRNLRNKFTFRGMYLISFFILLWITPFFDRSGIRYILPAMPLLVNYAVDVFKYPYLKGRIKMTYLKIALLFVILTIYLPGIFSLTVKKPGVVKGPQEKESQEVFRFISAKVPDSAIIVFRKPSVLAFYTGKKSYANHPGYDVKVMHHKLWQLKADYLLTSTDLPDPALTYYIKSYRNDLEIIFQNRKFRLYKRL